jgi:hypothetical protein
MSQVIQKKTLKRSSQQLSPPTNGLPPSHLNNQPTSSPNNPPGVEPILDEYYPLENYNEEEGSDDDDET